MLESKICLCLDFGHNRIMKIQLVAAACASIIFSTQSQAADINLNVPCPPDEKEAQEIAIKTIRSENKLKDGVVLVSKDHVCLAIESKFIKQSETIKNLIKEAGTEAPISLRTSTSAVDAAARILEPSPEMTLA